MHDEDPEVLADIELRESSARARSGLSETGFASAIREAAAKLKPKIVDRVPCRGRCGSLVDWTEEAEEYFAMFNRELLAKRDAPLDKTRIVFCIPCRTRGRIAAGETNRKHINVLGDVIRRIKESSNPDSEHELIKKARELNHPDVDGLLEALRAKNQRQPAGRRAKAFEVRR